MFHHCYALKSWECDLGLRLRIAIRTSIICMSLRLIVPYLHERGPMGGKPYIGPRLGDGPIFEVSVSQLDTKECPGKLSMGSS